MNGPGGIDHHHQGIFNTAAQQQQPQRLTRSQRKRKAEDQPENNERLSKRMSLLNLEHGGTKLYVPVENPQLQSHPSSSSIPPTPSSHRKQNVTPVDDDIMQLDDSKYKVYIYNMEDELSESESEDSGKLVFLPDIEKHLRNKRILPDFMDNLGNPTAGPDPVDMAQMQLVLYNIPSSITVPEEQDSVRKAIIEARARMRERQAKEQQTQTQQQIPTPAQFQPPPTNGFQSCAPANDDPDAMELD
ncbi:hypothetical protein V8F20_009164 [Naviculisporaceae sp. PSN 640]